ncbi:oligopeptide ABC transporter substrate-binding protein [Jeotgalibaca sp. MA1X17-3]|uniref:oligopeptide ABC transporter substrate-binding protein n=1 Tax=Jeotgalibaca sp. MA1X17-3 TaxID=2908211 RepID=UPI001F26A376|nr:oligopeptide ABC transporter substrate-binding protein [Jeotgalibaca sp. MA1X17-3]UJF14931.1 oligopeptide ABC transporter substrate-binding protein [Jeotgalibaca sp. MA1X17-3]
MLKKKLGLVSFAALTLTLAACQNDNDATTESGGTDTGVSESTSGDNGSEAGIPTFDTVMGNDEDSIEGGVLNYALVASSPFQGVFSPEFYEDAYDSELMGFTHEAMFSVDENFMLSQDGMATFEFDQEAATINITLKDDLKWSDGEPITTEDVLFSYEVIGSADYTGVRYGADFTNIVGMEDYHTGNSDTISGIKVIDDQNISIEYMEVNPSILQSGGGIWSYPMPKHQLENVAIADMAASDEVRKNPVGAGPFRVKSITPGESVEYEANEYYWKGAPKLDGVVADVVSPETVVSEVENGRYDVASMPTDLYDTYKDLDNLTLLGREQLAYTYLGFKLGNWEPAVKDDAGNIVTPARNVLNPDAKMADVNLRKAMAYAIDNNEIAVEFYQGLRENAKAMIPPVFADFVNEDIEGFYLDLEKAEQILDDAGYEDVDGDGFREDTEGNPLEIKFASMSGGATAEPIAQYYMQQWNEIGLNVTLSTGRLIEFQSFYDMLEADNEEIDIYQGAWGTGSDPNPTGLYGETAAYNYLRYVNDENTELLDKINSAESFDPEFKFQAFRDWQEHMFENVPVIPTLWRSEVFAVNNRVKNYDITYGTTDGWEAVELTSDSPY